MSNAVTPFRDSPLPEPKPAGAAAPPAKPDPVNSKPARAGQSSFIADAMVVSALTFLSRITGLVRDSYLGAAFGIGAISDAFWTGFLMPNLFRRLFGEGALTAAFIPVYTELVHHDPPMARKLGSLCLAVTGVLLTLITLIGLGGLTILLYAMDWSPDAALAIKLTLIMLPYMPLVCLVAIVGAMLQVHGKFAPSAGMPVFLNVVMIIGAFAALYTAPKGSEGLIRAVYVVSFAVVIGGVVQLITQTSLLFRYEAFTTDFTGTSAPFKKILNTLLPMFLSLAVFQINTAMDTLIAMGLSPKSDTDQALHLFGYVLHYPISQGGVTAMNNAMRLYQFPLGTFGLAIATAMLPALSHAAAETGEEGRANFRRILQQGLRLTFFIGLPASIGLILVREPLCRVIFNWGRVSVADTRLIASVLAGYAPAIWAYAMTHVINRAFYAMKDTRTPMILSLWMVGLNLTLNLILVWPLGVAGTAWSTAVCAILGNQFMLYKLRRFVDSPVDSRVWFGWGRTVACTAVMSLVLIPMAYLLNPESLAKIHWVVDLCVNLHLPWAGDPLKLPRLMAAVQLSAMVIAGGASFGAAAWLMKAEEIGWLRNRKSKAKKVEAA